MDKFNLSVGEREVMSGEMNLGLESYKGPVSKPSPDLRLIFKSMAW